ncbi:MAG: hypothetical protein E7535_07845 [Ruminococcaceae bacterium]|nr:hypothetical protein [Oscillospiraceae bacterium]
MTYFYKKDGEIFIPEKINPELAKLALAIVKTCKLSFKLQMKSTSLNNALKAGKREQMLDIIKKCLEKNRRIYNQDMSLTGVKVEEVEDSFFDDKSDDFLKQQLQVLIDFATINTVVESKMMPLMSGACEKTLGVPLNKIKFFSNQDVILEEPEDDSEEETEE